tara:strand:+ start:482 stop:676 length:195 start_codon:yes stop_codon:yes gene_type:complete
MIDGLFSIKKKNEIIIEKKIINKEKIRENIFFKRNGDEGKMEIFKLLNFFKYLYPLLSETSLIS